MRERIGPADRRPSAGLAGCARVSADERRGTHRGTPAAIELAVCAEMVFLELPIRSGSADRRPRVPGGDLGLDGHDVDALAATGARFSSMTGYIAGALADDDGAEELLRTAAKSVPVAERLGWPRLNLHGTGLTSTAFPCSRPPRSPAHVADRGPHPGPDRRPRGAGRGHLRLENLNTAVDHPGEPFARAADTMALVEAGRAAGLKMNLDLYHAQIGEGNLIELVRRAAPFIGEIQVADVPGRCEPGTGEINYPAIAQALEELGYRGTVGLEAWASGARAGPGALRLAFTPPTRATARHVARGRPWPPRPGRPGRGRRRPAWTRPAGRAAPCPAAGPGRAAAQQWQDHRGDPAGKVDAAGGQHGQGQVAGLGPEDAGEQPQGLGAQGRSRPRLHAGLDDRRARSGAAASRLGHRLGLGRELAVDQGRRGWGCRCRSRPSPS